METTSSGIILIACGVVPVAAIVPVYRLEHTGTIEEPLLYQVKVKRSPYHLPCFLQHTLSVLVAEIGNIIISCDTHRSLLLLKLVIPNNTTPSHGIIYHPTSKIQYLGKSRPTLLALQYSKKSRPGKHKEKVALNICIKSHVLLTVGEMVERWYSSSAIRFSANATSTGSECLAWDNRYASSEDMSCIRCVIAAGGHKETNGETKTRQHSRAFLLWPLVLLNPLAPRHLRCGDKHLTQWADQISCV